MTPDLTDVGPIDGIHSIIIIHNNYKVPVAPIVLLIKDNKVSIIL